MLFIGVFILLFAELGIKLFIRDEAAWTSGKSYLRVVALCYPFLSINFILNRIVRASGVHVPSACLECSLFLGAAFPLTWLLSNQYGSIGIALGIGASFIISNWLCLPIFSFWKIQGKGFNQHHVIVRKAAR